MKAVALQIEDGIHDVLEDSRPGDGSGFGHMADDEDRHTRGLGQSQQSGSALLHLADATSRRGQFLRIDRLDGIHYSQVRVQSLDVAHDLLQVNLGEDVELIVRDPQPISSHLDLLDRFLTGHIEHWALLSSQE